MIDFIRQGEASTISNNVSYDRDSVLKLINTRIREAASQGLRSVTILINGNLNITGDLNSYGYYNIMENYLPLPPIPMNQGDNGELHSYVFQNGNVWRQPVGMMPNGNSMKSLTISW